MASVDESSLNLAAHEVVANFVNEDVTLNEGVKKKASELGLNRDQTERLIERTNSEAFLKVFPEKTDFDVADPSVIFEEGTKVASHHGPKRPSYADYLNRDVRAIFGVSSEKTASEYVEQESVRSRWVDRVYTQRIDEELRIEKMAKLMAMEESNDKLFSLFKTQALSGTKVASMEKELFLAFPDRPIEVSAVVNTLVEKLACVANLSPEIMERASAEGFNPNEVVLDSPLIASLQEVLAYDKR